MKVTNWMVRVYDNNDQVIDSWCINERTEAEAVKEAESDPIILNNDSWTLMPVTKAELDELLELEENREARYQDWYEDAEQQL